LVEGTHAGPKSLRGAFLRNDGGASSAHYFGEDGGGDHAPDDQWNFASGPSYTAEQSQDRHEEVYYDEDGWQACSTCGSFAYPTEHNDDNDTDTESEADVEQMDTEEYKAYLGDMEGYGYDDLKTEYFFAKRRFRSFARRPPRRSRFPRTSFHRKGKGKWNGKGSQLFSTGKGGKGGFKGHGKFHGMGTVGPSSLAGGKGFKSSRSGNPTDASGQVMRCHECNSDEHLIRDCPRRSSGKGKSKGKGKRAYLADGTLSGNSPAGGLFAGVDHWFAEDMSTRSASEAFATHAPDAEHQDSWYHDSWTQEAVVDDAPE